MNSLRTSDPDSIQVIARAADVLRTVAEERDGIGLSDLSRRTSLARSTIQRIVKSLEDENFLEALPGRGGYTLGRGLHALLGHASIDVCAVVEPFLKELSVTVDETVDLSILQGSRALFVSHIAGRHRLAALSAVGMQFPLHSTANGKALLSCLTAKQREAVLPAELSADTPRSITNRTILLDQIDRCLETGISYDLEEHTEGVCAIGTGFLDGVGKPYAISIPVPQQRFMQKRDQLRAPLLSCRSQIIQAIGDNSKAATSSD